MRLKTLSLHHFRQFYASSPIITFHPSAQRNATAIFGDNGGGKTTLLNAFTWCLYGEFSEAVAEAVEKHGVGSLVNNRAVREAPNGSKVECWVQLTFEHAGASYVAKRLFSITKGENDSARTPEDEKGLGRLSLYKDHTDQGSPKSHLDRILPPVLSRYFFFDGERLERILSPNKAAQTKTSEATRKLLGIDVLYQTLENLKKAGNAFERECRGQGDSELDDLLDRKDRAKERADLALAKIAEQESNIAGFDSSIASDRKQMEFCKEVETLAKQRETVSQRLIGHKEEAESQKRELLTLISCEAHHLLQRKAIDQVGSLVKSLSAKGELPKGIKQTFVQELLDQGICICGTVLKEGCNHRQHLSEWLDRAGLEQVEERALSLQGRSAGALDAATSFATAYDGLQTRCRKTNDSITQAAQELRHLDDQLRGVQVTEVRAFVLRIDQQTAQRDAANVAMGEARADLKQAQEDSQDLENQIKQRNQRGERLRQSMARLQAARDAKKVLEEVERLYRQHLHHELEGRTAVHFAAICAKAYQSRLSDGYVPYLVNAQDVNVPPSQGEALAHAAAFLCAIIALRKDQARNPQDIGGLVGSGDACLPVVMDSPFGNLGAIFRREVAALVSSVADQSVILVSPTQWRGEVESVISARLSGCYRIISHSAVTEQNPTIEVNGREISLWAPSETGDVYSTIEPIEDPAHA